MSRLIMWNVISLDGAFEGPEKWHLDFHRTVLGAEFDRFAIAQLHGADRLLFGRFTFEGMAAYWPAQTGEVADLMNALPKIVITSRGLSTDWKNVTVETGDAVACVRRLKSQGDGETLVFGSGKLSETLDAHDLFDEYRICIAPVILGSGTALFGKRAAPRALRFLDARPLESGGVILRYGAQSRATETPGEHAGVPAG
jgi:dihydrofolate reductase